MKGIISNYLLIILAVKCCYGKDGMKFTDLDLRVVGRLTRQLGAESVVFVEDEEDTNLVRTVKTSLDRGVFRAVMNSTVLANVLSFLQKRTVVVTKEKLKFSHLLNLVSAPFYVTWLVFGNYPPLEKFYIPVNSNFIFIDHAPGMVYAKQVYNVKQGRQETVKIIWRWDLNSGSDTPMELQRLNFDNVSMDMLSLIRREGCKNLSTSTLLPKLECVHQDFLQMMGERLNFSINLVECVEKEHPFVYPNGSESELFLRLRKKEVDFSAVSHVVFIHRKRTYMEFLWPTFLLRSRMYLKQGRLVGHWVSYLRPLESCVWWSILTWILLTGVLIHVFDLLLANRLKFNILLVFELIMSTLRALQVFCNQALSDIPTANSIRIVYLLKFFVVLIFFQAYCAYLVSSLTVVVSRFPFHDLKGLLENQEYQTMTIQKGFHNFFVRKVIGQGQRENLMLPVEKLPITTQEAVDKLCIDSHLVFVDFREDLLNLAAFKCRISEFPSPIAHLYMGIAMPRGSPLKEFLTREFLHLRSTGIVHKSATRLSFHSKDHSNFRDQKSQDEFTKVSMTYVFSIFILLAAGILVSFAILIIEVIIERLWMNFVHFEREGQKKTR